MSRKFGTINYEESIQQSIRLVVLLFVSPVWMLVQTVFNSHMPSPASRTQLRLQRSEQGDGDYFVAFHKVS
jgi:hypothetical protein